MVHFVPGPQWRLSGDIFRDTGEICGLLSARPEPKPSICKQRCWNLQLGTLTGRYASWMQLPQWQELDRVCSGVGFHDQCIDVIVG